MLELLFLLYGYSTLKELIGQQDINIFMLIQLNQRDIKEVRENILTEQYGKCAICGCTITEESGISLDHQHKRKSDTNGNDGAGLIRGVLCRNCNVLEGKIWNGTSRYIQPNNVQERINFLENLVEYYKKDNYSFIHPSEKPLEPLVSKRNYNKLKKKYSGKSKFPEYPKSKKITKKLQELFDYYQISPYN